MIFSRHDLFPTASLPRRGAATRFAAYATVALTMLAVPASAQTDAKPVAPPGPAIGSIPKPVKTLKFTLVFTRPGSYLCYPVKNGRKGEGISIKPGQNTLPVEVTPDIDGIEILDEVNGLVATRAIGKIKPNSKVRILADAFDQLQAVIVELKSKNGQPAAKGVVRLTPAKGEPLQYGLSAMDNGSVRFENIPLGKAEALAYANTGDDVVKQTLIIAPVVGGKAQLITLTLPVDVQTLSSPSPAPAASAGGNGTPTIIVNTGEPKQEPKNDWSSGIFGLIVLAGLGFLGFRYLKQRGMTPKEGIMDALVKLGVDAPGAAIPGSMHTGLKGSAPDSVASKLPSLAELPEPSMASGPVLAQPDKAFVGPRLIGLTGEYAGRTVALQSDTENRLTIGRDPVSTISLPKDNAVSRKHAVIVPNGPGWDLMDEASQNGTFVNSRRIDSPTALTSGDVIQIGTSRFRFEV